MTDKQYNLAFDYVNAIKNLSMMRFEAHTKMCSAFISGEANILELQKQSKNISDYIDPSKLEDIESFDKIVMNLVKMLESSARTINSGRFCCGIFVSKGEECWECGN